MTKSRIIPVYMACGLAISALSPWAPAQADIGTSRQPLVGGPVVDQQTRRELGLLTLSAPGPAPAAPGALFPGPPGSKVCSATLLNDFWALTASHCIDAATSPSQVTLTANWGGMESRKAVDVRSFQWTHNLDVALIMIDRPFPRVGSPPYAPLSHRPTADLQGQRIEVFGRGINALAWQPAGGMPIPSQSDGQYRSSDFEVFQTSSGAFTYRSIPGAGRAVAGGDSGGPSYFRVWDDYTSPNRQIVRMIAGVHSSCQVQCLPGQACGATAPNRWAWVANIPECTDASIETIRNEIASSIAQVPKQPYVERPPIDTDLLTKPDPGYVTKPGIHTRDVVVDSGVATRPNSKAMVAVGPQTCKTGFVWRAASATDYVCVTPESRARTVQDNAAAASRVDPAGAYGPSTCIAGYVWREAFAGDVVCVAPAVRDAVREENRLGPSRRQGG